MTVDPQQMARDWITIWQSELNAAATDRELLEGFTRLVDQWAQAAQAAAALLPGADDARRRRAAAGCAGAGTPAGAAPAAAASDARDAAIERLAERVAELERIIEGLSRRP
jgi:hypothetical protein